MEKKTEIMIYFNNAATSFPKPNEVLMAIIDCMKTGGFSSGRGSKSTYIASDLITETRELIADFFNGEPSNVIFCHNATEAINLAIHGYLKLGDHVITSQMDHNAVLRPLNFLEKRGKITISVIKCSKEGFLDPNDIENEILDNTSMICITHASNVVGTILPIKEVGKLASKNNITLLVDVAQSAGVIPIDMKKLNIDLLGFTGHKSLYGPQGIGGLIIKEGLEDTLIPLKQGGTGIISDEPYHEKLPLPDKFEAGTHNCHGIVGLKAGIEFVKKKGINNIRQHESALLTNLIKGLQEIEGIKIYGPCDPNMQLSTVSINADGFSPDELGYILDKSFRIITRSGLQCAPLTHKCIGSYDLGGTDRLSLGFFNTPEEIEIVINSINLIIKKPEKHIQKIEEVLLKTKTKKPIIKTFKRLSLEDCFKREGGRYFFEEIQTYHIEFLKPFGYLEIFDKFPKIFCRIDRPNYFRLKATIGTNEIEVYYKEVAEDNVQWILENQLAKLSTCNLCGECVEVCHQNAISISNIGFRIDLEKCDNCLECTKHVCPHIDTSSK